MLMKRKVVSGEKMNQFPEPAKITITIANHQSLNDPMARWTDTECDRRRRRCYTEPSGLNSTRAICGVRVGLRAPWLLPRASERLNISSKEQNSMAARTSEAEWKGDLLHGKGTMKLGSGAYEGQYSFSSRFESGTGTNPEELIAAAHAGLLFHGPLRRIGQGRLYAHAHSHHGHGAPGESR